MFKPGDKAWHPQWGWGVIRDSKLTDKPIYLFVEPLSSEPLYSDGFENKAHINPVIFHREQKFDLSEPEPEIGTWGYFWNGTKTGTAVFGRFEGISNEGKFKTSLDLEYNFFSPSLPQHIKDMMEGKG